MGAFVTLVFVVGGVALLWWTTATESGRRFAADPVVPDADQGPRA